VILHVLTACTRPWNLSKISPTLEQAALGTPWQVHWHIGFDPQRAHIGGQGVKNRLLEGISEGWVWILDDDTTVHPDLLRRVGEEIERDPSLQAVVVSQKRPEGVLVADPVNVRVGHIDSGQVVLHRGLIGGTQLLDKHDADGHFFEALLRDAPGVSYLNEILCFHNALEGEPCPQP